MADIRDSFEALVATDRAGLVSTAYGVLRDVDEAEDVVQETVTAVWSRLADSSPRHLRAYVYRAVELNALKRRRRRPVHVDFAAVADTLPDLSEMDPLCEIDPWTLERAVHGLPAAQQVVLRMKYYLGLTFREIGEALAISANTAASRCRYALRSLRRRFEPPRETEKGGRL